MLRHDVITGQPLTMKYFSTISFAYYRRNEGRSNEIIYETVDRVAKEFDSQVLISIDL